MDTMRKCMVLCGMAAMGILGIVLMAKVARSGHQTGVYAKVGNSIDVSLKESMAALDKATAHIHSVYEHLKNRKS
jgi:hypothetical protein